MDIRHATNHDAGQLQQIMANTPQSAGDFVFTFVNEPDFFARARAYEAATIFVADDQGQLAGSAACAIRDVVVGGAPCRVGYEFQYFTSPEHRQKGVARRLHEQIEAHLRRAGAELSTAIITDSNQPSIRLFEGQGFRRHRDLALVFLIVRQHVDMRADQVVRPAVPDDLATIAHLLNATWHGSDLYGPTSAEALDAFVRRTPELGLDRLLILEERGAIVACAGLWDWGRVQRIELRSVDPLLEQRFPAFRTGAALRQWGLTPVGFKTPDDLAALLRHVNNRALAQGIDQVALVGESDSAVVRASSDLPRTIAPIGFHLKQLQPRPRPVDGPLFVDMIDL